MKSKRLLDLISEIDPELIEKADEQPEKKAAVNKHLLISLVSVAACLVVVLSVSFFIKNSSFPKTKMAEASHLAPHGVEQEETVVSIISNYIDGGSIAHGKQDFLVNPDHKDSEKQITYECPVELNVTYSSENESTLSFEITDPEMYGTFYTYCEYKLRKIDGKVAPEITPIVDTVPVTNTKITFEDKTTDLDIELEALYGNLEPGEYRIEVTIYGTQPSLFHTTVRCDFTVE